MIRSRSVLCWLLLSPPLLMRLKHAYKLMDECNKSFIYVPQHGVSSPGLFYTPAEKIRSFYSDSQKTRDRILSTSSLFWGISTNEPLNEHLLYSSRSSWGKNIEEE